MSIIKLIRTLQSELPFLKKTKDNFYLHSRRLLRVPHERDFRAIAKFPSDWSGPFVDVGGNLGQSIESILLYRPDAEIVSFEANPVLARVLMQRYSSHQQISVRPIGLGSLAGDFTLYVPSYHGFLYDGLASLDSQLAETWISSNTVYRFNPKKLTIAKIACTIETLDSQKLQPSFIKIDVQGLEYDVLLGGKETIKRSEPILLIEDFNSDKRMVHLAAEWGYEEYGFDGEYFIKGHPENSPNSFLLRPWHLSAFGARQTER